MARVIDKALAMAIVAAVLLALSLPFGLQPGATPLTITVMAIIAALGGLSLRWPVAGGLTLLVVLLTIVLAGRQFVGLSIVAYAVAVAASIVAGKRLFGVAVAAASALLCVVMSVNGAGSIPEALQAVAFWAFFFGASVAVGLALRWQYDRLSQQEREQREFVTAFRLQVARDLHDTVSQSLVPVMLLSQKLRDQVCDDDPIAQDLEVIADSGRQADAQLRLLLALLRSAETEPYSAAGLTEPGALLDKIEAEARRLREKSADARVSITGAMDIVPTQAGLAFAAALREAVANVLKHADLTRPVTVVVGTSVHTLEGVVVNDRRQGPLDPDRPRFGLSDSRAQLEAVGGRLDTAQTRQQWITRLEVPLT